MNSTATKLVSSYRRLPASTAPIVAIVLAIVLGNVMYFSGLATINPISWTASISHFICRVTCGRPMIDPNVGFISQPLGHLSAMDLLHGHLPWWNYFEGLGQPLAGEMQSAALFPLTLLFALPSGLLWFHVALEVIAGISTYFLARRLSVPVVIATGAGILFALNGTFAWIGNAVLNPVAFLPMLLLGIEIIFDRAKSGSRRGWYLAAVALALSLYAGFPEVAYIDGVFAGGWAIVRLFTGPREYLLVTARRLGLAGIVGSVLALPIIVPFYDFYKVAFIGSHTGALDGSIVLPIHTSSMLMDPYVYGTILSNPNAVTFWGSIGGYFGSGVVALALLGIFGSRYRALRMYLVIWTLFGLASIFNIFHTRQLWNLFPLVKTLALTRYIMPSCSMAIIVLAALGIMDFATSKRAKLLFTFTSLGALALLTWSALAASSINNHVVLTHTTRIIFIGLDAIPFISIGLLLVIGRFSKFRVATLLITVVIVGESLALFFVPSAEAPKRITVDQAPIAFLQANQGQYRFLDFGVLTPNWPSQFGLNSLNAIDLPFPKAFANLLATKLFPTLSPLNQFTIHSGITGIGELENAVVNNFSAFEAASVKYLLISHLVIIDPRLTKLGVHRVFHDALASIYEMPSPRPFFSTTSTSCTVTSTSVNSASVSCPSGASTLIRTELSMPGWQALVNGQPATITTLDGVYQGVAVPAGTSSVTYSFLPPHEFDAVLAALLAVLFILGTAVYERRRRPKSQVETTDETTDGTTDETTDETTNETL